MMLLMILGAISLAEAEPEALRKQLAGLQVLSLDYGVNRLTVAGVEVLINKAIIENGNGWSNILYSIMVEDSGDAEEAKPHFQWVRIEDGQQDKSTISALPHTGEDSIKTIYFMIPKIDGVAIKRDEPPLYLLQVERRYHESPTNAALADFSLLALKRDADNMALYFRKIHHAVSVVPYHNADCAAWLELGISMPQFSEDCVQ
ncbi:MAG: hypothetical protein ACOYK8_00310 [Alphaproteobacteria bacterium]